VAKLDIPDSKVPAAVNGETRRKPLGARTRAKGDFRYRTAASIKQRYRRSLARLPESNPNQKWHGPIYRVRPDPFAELFGSQLQDLPDI